VFDAHTRRFRASAMVRFLADASLHDAIVTEWCRSHPLTGSNPIDSGMGLARQSSTTPAERDGPGLARLRVLA
jgi:hypothetical protein